MAPGKWSLCSSEVRDDMTRCIVGKEESHCVAWTPGASSHYATYFNCIRGAQNRRRVYSIRGMEYAASDLLIQFGCVLRVNMGYANTSDSIDLTGKEIDNR